VCVCVCLYMKSFKPETPISKYPYIYSKTCLIWNRDYRHSWLNNNNNNKFHVNSKHSCKITSNKQKAFNAETEMKNKTSMENRLLENVISLPKFSSCIFFKALLPHNFRMLNYLAPLSPNLTTLCNCHVELWQSSLQWHNFHTKFLRTRLSCSQAKRRETNGQHGEQMKAG